MNVRLTLAAIVLSVVSALNASAEVKHLLPVPHSVSVQGSPFALNRAVKVENTAFEDVEMLNDVLNELGCTIDDGAAATITLNKVGTVAGTDEPTLNGFEPEAYRLVVDGDHITIEASSRVGVIRAAQTLLQLGEEDDDDDNDGIIKGSDPLMIPSHSDTSQGQRAIEGVTIVDWPAFKVRGFMHDVGRSFITVDELEKQIKLYSRFKINVFQWHMTENQAWRFEVKTPADNTTGFDFSKLTAVSNMTRFAGKYYSQEDCRRLDSIAHRYGVYIIPELDMPGHSEAFTRATGVNMQTDKGVAILTEALSQCCEVFAHSPYIHIGGDEVAITYTNFLNRMSDVVRARDKKVVWWNTCAGVGTTHKLVDPTTDHCDMAQCWASSGRKVSGIPCIDCRYNYTNHFDVFADLVGMYRSTILGDQDGKNGTAGFISCPWNDRKTPTQEDIIKQNNVYAVTIASGERAWKGGGRQYIEQGGAVLPNSGDEYDEFCDWERRFLFHKAHSLHGEPIPYVKQTNVRWRISSPVQNGGNKAMAFAEWENCKDTEAAMPSVVSLDGKTYGWTMATGAGIYLNHTWGSATVPGIWGKVTQPKNQTAYAYTYVYNPDEEHVVGAQIEFQNYGRSEKDPAPQNGNWDRKGSQIWWNGEPIAPPTWGNNGGGGGNNETPLLNENFPARQPIALTLRSGWNKVFIKLPYVNDDCRLSKWMFTFVLTDLEGTAAIDGIVYSPYKTLGGAEAEALLGRIDAIEAEVSGSLSDKLGYYPVNVADELMQQLTAIREAASLPEADIAQLTEQVEQAYNAYKSSLSSKSVNMPQASTSEKEYWYTLKDRRGNKFVTATAVAGGLVGNTARDADHADMWKLVARSNGTYDLVNCKFGCSITNTAANNSQLTTSATKPNNGWTITYSGASGYFIITNGSVQLHQATNANVLNWGGGSNTTDGGCLYSIEDVSSELMTSSFLITDEAGNQYSGTYSGGQGVEPQFDGVEGYTLTDKAWTIENDDVLFTANITFPFSVSGVDYNRYNNISAFSGDQFNWYANANGNLYATKGASGAADQYQWTITPQLDGHSFSFTIRNKKYNKYVYTASTANSHNEGTVRLSDHATRFQYRSNGFATTLSPSKFLSVNSASPTTAQSVGTWDVHNGTKLKITLMAEEPTAIHSASAVPATTDCYDLSGRRLTGSSHKGLIIKNHKKYINSK